MKKDIDELPSADVLPMSPMPSTFPELPPQISFSKEGRQYLDSFYQGHDADTTAKKIDAIHRHILKEDVLVTSSEGVENLGAELVALEYYVLTDAGFNE